MPTLQTQAELLKEHREQLDRRFVRKYPAGKFCLQNFHGFSLHWCPRRSTGARRYLGVSTAIRIDYATKVVKGIEHAKSQNNSFGNCYNYDSLDKLLKACVRHNVPGDLVAAFEERYNNRASEGFTK